MTGLDSGLGETGRPAFKPCARGVDITSVSPQANRREAWSEYAGLSASQRKRRQEDHEHRSIRDLVSRWYYTGDYAARDVLIERGVFDDTKSSTPNDYAHALLVEHVGAVRIAKPRPGRSQIGSRAAGVMLPGFRHFDVRVREPNPDGTPRYVTIGSRASERFQGTIAVLFAEDFRIEGAFVVPRSVTDAHARASGLPIPGAWMNDPEVEQLAIPDEF